MLKAFDPERLIPVPPVYVNEAAASAGLRNSASAPAFEYICNRVSWALQDSAGSMVETARQTSPFAQAVTTGPSPTAAHEMPPITAAAMTPATTPRASLVRLATTTPPFGMD